MSHWDYIIVGAGSAGCAVAERLSASGSHRVLLLEAGGTDRSMRISLPAGPFLFDNQSFDWGYRSAPDATRAGKSELWSRGRVLGGSSSINGMNYVRGSASDYDGWAALGNAGWDSQSVLPLFRELERCDPESIPDSPLRGREGPLYVRSVNKRHPVVEAFIRAAQAAGYPFTPDYNGAVQEGIGYSQMSQRGRRRWSAADAFLKPALRRKSLELKLRAQVHKLLIQDRRVVGLRYEQKGRLHEVRSGRVILCAGAINTPHLLMLSGIGDAAALRQCGITTVLDRKAVGRNLMEHPLIRLIYQVSKPTYNLTQGPLQKLRLLGRYLLNGEGPLSFAFESVGFLRTGPEQARPDVQLHVTAFGYESTAARAQDTSVLLPFPSITVLVNKNHPRSRGRIALGSTDPNAAPLIEPNLLASIEDSQTLARGIRMVRRIVRAAPMSEWISQEIRPSADYESEGSLEAYVRAHTEIAYHPCGTCRMGPDDEAVVTPDLKVRGIENLWIADASIMPEHISGNINAACMMIGMKLGRQLAAQRG